MSSAALVSLEEYLHRSEKPLCEYMDGVLQPKPMPTKLHGRIQYVLVALLRRQNAEALAATIQSPNPIEPVLWCAEILSPEDRLGATLTKCEQPGWHYHFGGEPERVERGGVLRGGALSVRLEDLFPEVREDQ
jgi:hypothetical protein